MAPGVVAGRVSRALQQLPAAAAAAFEDTAAALNVWAGDVAATPPGKWAGAPAQRVVAAAVRDLARCQGGEAMPNFTGARECGLAPHAAHAGRG